MKYCITIPDTNWTLEEYAPMVEGVLNALAAVNAQWFLRNPEAPCCLDCGEIRYEHPPRRTTQDFPNAPTILRRKRTGCAGAAAYVAGKEIAAGNPARVRVLLQDGTLHAVVELADGSITDPSQELAR